MSQTLWEGPLLTFSKGDYVDWSAAANQDCITSKACLTRADKGELFNTKEENEYDRDNKDSPIGTKWANGSLSDGIENLTFTSWFQWPNK